MSVGDEVLIVGTSIFVELINKREDLGEEVWEVKIPGLITHHFVAAKYLCVLRSDQGA